MDHINGDRLDNRLENLRLLCPNCQTQTETFSKGNRADKKERIKKRIFDINFFSIHREVPSKQEVLKILGLHGVYNTYKILNISKDNFYALCKYYQITVEDYERKIKTKDLDLRVIQQKLLLNCILDVSRELDIADTALRKFAIKNGLFLPSSIHKSYWLKIKNGSINPVKFEHLSLENGKYVLNNSYIKSQ